MGGTVTVTDERVWAEIGSAIITNAMIAANAVAESQILNDAVTTSKILALNVTGAKIAADAITVDKIADNTVETAQIKDAMVTSAKLAQPKPYSCRATSEMAGTNVPTGGSGTALCLATEDFDSAAMHDLVTNNSRVTCKRAGRYFIFGDAWFTGNSGGTYRTLYLRKNATNFPATDTKAPIGTTFSGCTAGCYIELALNDYIQLVAEHNAGVTLEVYSASLSLVSDG